MDDNSDDILKALFQPSHDTVLVDVLRRQVWIDGDIDEHTARDVIRGVSHVLRLGPSMPVEVLINSSGGCALNGLAISDFFMQKSKEGSVISTIVYGASCSAAALISASGTKGHRKTFRSARFLIHQLSAGVQGKHEELESSIGNLNKINDSYIEIISKITKKPIKAVGKDLSKEYFMSAAEAVKYGLVDHIL